MKNKILGILESLRPEFDFGKNDNFIEEGLLDSFDLISLVSCLDKEFNISIDGVDIVPENFMNIDAIESMLQKYIKE